MTTAWDIERQVAYPLISAVEPHPEGGGVLFVAREPVMTDDRSEFVTQIYRVDEGGEVAQLTFGDRSCRSPRWSPDGHHIAFVAQRDGVSELRCMRAAGGESWLLASSREAPIALARWSRDGLRLAFVAAAPPSEELERARRARDDARRWGEDLRPSQAWVVPFAVGPRRPAAPEAATPPDFHVTDCDWLADGSGLAFTAMPTPLADTWPASWLGVAPLGGAPRRLADVGTYAAAVAVSPDGALAACAVSAAPRRWAAADRVTLISLADGSSRALAATPDEQPVVLGWAPDGAHVYVAEAERVGARLYAIPLDGGRPRPLPGPPMFEAAAAGADGRIAVAGEDFDMPNAVFVVRPSDETFESLGGPPLPEGWPDAPLPRAEVLQWRSPDGSEVEGILTLPPAGEGPFPLVVVVHGGPTGVYQRTYLGTPVGYGPLCALAERGYAVLRANPRGSSGYGRAFRFANYGDWGGGDFQDIMAGVDSLVARGLADPQRMAIMGWSYGGFMTSWAITQTDRFRAACIGAPVTDPVSFNGTSDIPSFVPDYFGAEHWDDLEPYRRQSPLLNVASARTPALIQHGEADVRVPLGQGRQLYEALRRRGVPAELVVYPRQGHSFGEPRMIVDCRRRALAWIERHLRG